jgi:hypothetical protein
MQRTDDDNLRAKARSHFEQFIAHELEVKTEVDTKQLANAFYAQEEQLLRRIAAQMIIVVLVKWADDILNQSIGLAVARNGHAQLTLPLCLDGVVLPGAYSFISGANKVKWVAVYKATMFHLESHAVLLRRHEEEVRDSRLKHEQLIALVTPVMDTPQTTLREALDRLRESEHGGTR